MREHIHISAISEDGWSSNRALSFVPFPFTEAMNESAHNPLSVHFVHLLPDDHHLRSVLGEVFGKRTDECSHDEIHINRLKEGRKRDELKREVVGSDVHMQIHTKMPCHVRIFGLL